MHATFWNTPRPWMMLETRMMSFSLSVRNSPSFQSSAAPLIFAPPRNPASRVRATTCWSGGAGSQKPFLQQGLRRIGAAELERGRRAVRFRIPGVERHFREDLVGQADHRIETAEG